MSQTNTPACTAGAYKSGGMSDTFYADISTTPGARPLGCTVAPSISQAKKNLAKIAKKYLQTPKLSYIITNVVTLIAKKREVAALVRGFSVERMSS